MPELLSYITKEDTERKQRAARFEHLTRQRIRYESAVAKLQALLVDPAPFRKILDLARQVPAEFVTRKSVLGISGGMQVALLLTHIAGDMLEQCEVKLRGIKDGIELNQQHLASTKAALKSEFGE